MPDFASLSLPALLVIFVGAGAVVWLAGTRLTHLVDQLADVTGMGKGFAGLLLLGGITSLPEVATVGTAAAAGNPALAINNLLGSASINVLLLAVGDIFFGREALTSRAARPVTLMQGVLGMMLMAGVALAATVGDLTVPGLQVGVGALLLAGGCIFALRLSARFEGKHLWDAVDPPQEDMLETERPERSRSRLLALIGAAGLTILIAGSVLALSADAIAAQSGLGNSLVGFVLLGFGTSLPELSSIFAALKLRRYELAIGDIFGTNLFNILLILLADATHRSGAVLGETGAFEVAGAILAVLMTGIFVTGLLERRDRTILRMGYDSALSIVAFGGGLFALSRIA